MSRKSFLRSKTLGVNLFLASAMEMSASVKAWVTTHPESAVLGCMLISIVLRHFTHSPLYYRKPKT